MSRRCSGVAAFPRAVPATACLMAACMRARVCVHAVVCVLVHVRVRVRARARVCARVRGKSKRPLARRSKP